MSSDPLPFGDPTNIQRENAEAIKKGVLMGCGGCSAVVVVGVTLGALLMAGIFYIVIQSMRSSEPSQMALQMAQQSEVIRQEIGEPMSLGWWVNGSIRTTGDEGQADFSVPVYGSKGGVEVQMSATRTGGKWQATRVGATMPSGETVILQPTLPAASPEGP